jgi:hypothetical protein
MVTVRKLQGFEESWKRRGRRAAEEQGRTWRVTQASGPCPSLSRPMVSPTDRPSCIAAIVMLRTRALVPGSASFGIKARSGWKDGRLKAEANCCRSLVGLDAVWSQMMGRAGLVMTLAWRRVEKRCIGDCEFECGSRRRKRPGSPETGVGTIPMRAGTGTAAPAYECGCQHSSAPRRVLPQGCFDGQQRNRPQNSRKGEVNDQIDRAAKVDAIGFMSWRTAAPMGRARRAIHTVGDGWGLLSSESLAILATSKQDSHHQPSRDVFAWT